MINGSTTEVFEIVETGHDTPDMEPDAQTAEPLPLAGEGPQL
jgi:hypothetical protein